MTDRKAGERIITLAEWDSATTEQRAVWLKERYLITVDDALTLEYRARMGD